MKQMAYCCPYYYQWSHRCKIFLTTSKNDSNNVKIKKRRYRKYNLSRCICVYWYNQHIYIHNQSWNYPSTQHFQWKSQKLIFFHVFSTFLIKHMDINRSMMSTKINTIISNNKGINSTENDKVKPAWKSDAKYHQQLIPFWANVDDLSLGMCWLITCNPCENILDSI